MVNPLNKMIIEINAINTLENEATSSITDFFNKIGLCQISFKPKTTPMKKIIANTANIPINMSVKLNEFFISIELLHRL